MGGGPDAGKGVRVMHKELQALIAQAKGQTDQAIALLKEAAEIEESMRPPNGAADPIKPSHELLGEVLLQAGKAKEAADVVRGQPASHAEPRPLADGRGQGARRRRPQGSARPNARRR